MSLDAPPRVSYAEANRMPERKLKLGIAGMGRGFLAMLPTLALHPAIAVVAGMDPRPDARQRFAEDFRARTYESFEALCSDADVEAVYIASPHQFHREQVEIAARHRKHMLVEKPMALSVEDCLAMADAANAADVALIVGHSHSFDAPIRRTRELIQSGAFGRLRMISAMNYTDYLYRPRRSEELQTKLGGGVVFSQGAHQIDIVQTIAGRRAASVRAYAGCWDPGRPTESAYSALLSFEDGTTASMIYSGHAHFDSDEFCDWIGETGRYKDQGNYGAARRLIRNMSPSAEDLLKRDRGYGGPAYVESSSRRLNQYPQTHHEHFGLLIASCDGADLRPGPRGVTIYGDEAVRFEPIADPAIPRSEVIDELYAAAVEGKRPFHSAEWGTANQEICLAILQSHREKRDVILHHQIKASEAIVVV